MYKNILLGGKFDVYDFNFIHPKCIYDKNHSDDYKIISRLLA